MEDVARCEDHPSLTPKQAMWEKLRTDYVPSPHPSHITCHPPVNNKPTPAIIAMATFPNCLISTTILRLAISHCFDADYSNCFHPTMGNKTLCPCATIPHPPPTHPPHQAPWHHWHTKAHIIFHCLAMEDAQSAHLCGLHSLCQIFMSTEATLQLCTFLQATNSSLLCLLPMPRPGMDPP